MKKTKENIEKKEETPVVTSEAGDNKKIDINECEIPATPKLVGLNEADFTPTVKDLQIKFTKTQSNIPVCKPSKQNYFMAHPTIEFYLRTIVWEKDSKTYIVTPEALPFCAEEVKPFKFFLCIYPQGSVFLHSIPVDSEEEEGSPGQIWHENDEKVIAEARTRWVNRKANKSIKGYAMKYPVQEIPEPQWPKWTRQEIFDKAFKDVVIRDENHPVIKYLQGRTE